MKCVFLQRWLMIALCLWLAACGNGPETIDLNTIEGGSSGRGSASLNEGWQFRRGEGQPLANIAALDDSWSEVVLPHTWNIEDGADGGDNYFRGDGWYHRSLTIAEDLAGRRFYLHFNGANLVADVYLNERHLGQHRGGYAAFRFDITDSVTPGETNILSVKVNNARNDDIPPLAADFTFYGGLYRGVDVIVTRPLHIEIMDYASPGVFISQRSVSAEQADIDIKSTVVNDGDSEQSATVHFKLVDAEGEIVVEKSLPVTVAARGSVAVEGSMSLKNPHLWQGMEDPYLYQLHVRVERAGVLSDALQQSVGLRRFTVSATEGAFLNGKSARLRGVSRHQDREGKGWAVSRKDHREDFELIAEMGTNAVRLAHYQHDEYVYQLADEMGFMVWAEVPVISEVTDSEAFTASAKQQLKELIRQNYNHPSIVMWGLFNEISIHGSEANTRLVEKLEVLAKKEDSTRLTTGAVLGDHEEEGVWMVPDIIAQNRYDGWYYREFDGMAAWLDKIPAIFPERAVGISEYGAGASTDLHADQPVNQDHTEEYQNRYHEANWLIMRERPQMWGSFIWNMFDFSADLRDEGSTPGINDKGMVSFNRETKKDSFYWYQSHWRDEPMLYITSRRFDVRKTPDTDIKIYSNLDELELLVNGKSQGVQCSDGTNIFLWPSVALVMGENTVAVRGGDLAHGMMGNPPAKAHSVVDGNDKLDGESGEVAFWITADPNQGPGWLKIDLGANYYIDRLDAAWLPRHINENGVVQYTIEIAEDIATSAVVFAETYREVGDGRDNKVALRTTDKIGAMARYLRVNVLDSSYTYDVPILGTFKLIGATEFSVYGGLISSPSLSLDYKQRQITLPAKTTVPETAVEIISQLQAVTDNAFLEVWSSDSRLNRDDPVKVGDYLLISLENDPLKRRERYNFVASVLKP